MLCVLYGGRPSITPPASACARQQTGLNSRVPWTQAASAMDQAAFKTQLSRTFALPFVLMAVLAGILFWVGSRETAAMQWVDHSDQVIGATRQATRVMSEMESGLRGYLYTGSGESLRQYQTASAEAGTVFDQLDQLVADNPQQRERALQFRRAASQWQNYADEMLAAQRSGGDYQSWGVANRGQELMDASRERREELVRVEDMLRDARVRAAQRDSKLFLGLAIGLALLLALVLALITRRRMIAIAHSYDETLAVANQQNRELSETQRRLDAVLASMAEGLYQLDPRGTLIYLNAAGERLLGYRMQEVLGKNMHDLVHSRTPDGQGRTWEECPLLSVVKNGNPYHAPEDYLIRKDGAFLPVETTSAPIALSGDIIGAVVTFRDLTERKRVEQALRASDKLVMAGRLAATIAHEINNPLESVDYLLYLMTQEPLSASTRHSVQTAREELKRVVEITRHVLSLHREAQAPVPVKIPEIIDGLFSLYDRKLHTKGVRVVKRYENTEAVRVFPGEIRQVFSNLLGNAIDAVGQGGVISVHVFPSHEWGMSRRAGTRVVIADNGGGIPPEAREKIFEPFFTTKAEKGTGLGLWVSQGIIQKHEGSIRMRTSTVPGHTGTSFSIFLPQQPSSVVQNAPVALPSAS